MAGAFQTSREIFENPIWQNIVEFRLFFLLYGKAIFNEEGYQQGKIKIEKGQWLRSYRNLQNDLEYIENRSIKKYSLSRIKRAIDNLIKEERIKIEDTELGTLFTVLNYAKYQDLDTYKNHNENGERTQRERRENAERTQRERRENNNKKEKKEKKDKKENKSNMPDFDLFWAAYPKKISKKQALTAWEKLKPNEELTQDILKGVQRWKSSDQWEKDSGKFIPYPATFLNGERWMDECETNTAFKDYSNDKDFFDT